MPGPFWLPADVDEGDYIEIGMLGAYGVAMNTRFNGFGDTDAARSRTRPWPRCTAWPPRSSRRRKPAEEEEARKVVRFSRPQRQGRSQATASLLL
jgi:ornithine decarboxylase